MITTLSEFIDRVDDGRPMRAAHVAPRVLRCRVWLAAECLPGCLPDWSQICTSKADAVAALVWLLDHGDSTGAPRGMRAALVRDGIFRHAGFVYSVEQLTINDLL